MSSAPAWTAEQRQKGWIVISFARTRLKLTISPCLADSYVILHHYFSTERDREHKFCILLTAALFLSCKIEDMFRPMDSIFKELCICLQITSSKLGAERTCAIFGDRDYANTDLTQSEIDEICSLEVDFLNALDWNTQIELPFEYVNRHWYSIIRDTKSDLSDRLDLITRDISFLLCSDRYLELSPSCSAAASLFEHMRDVRVPLSVSSWIESERERDGETFEYALALIRALGEIQTENREK